MKSAIIFFAIFFFSLSVNAQQEIVHFEVSDNTKMSILLTFETIHILDSISEKLWPGWSTKNLTYFLGAMEGNTILINPHFSVPTGFRKYEEMSKNENVVFIKEESNQRFVAVTDWVLLDGKRYTAVTTTPHPFAEEYGDTLFAQNCPLEYHISVQIHEAFHIYQQPKWDIFPLRYTVDPKYYRKPKIMAYSYIEGMLLFNALNANSKEEFLQSVHKFITVRKEKNKKLRRRQYMTESIDEFIEGTAQYIQTKSQIMLQELNYKPQVLSPEICGFDKASVFMLYDSLGFISVIENYNTDAFESKCYYYGQAQAYILDKLCGNIWKQEIMEGKTLMWNLIQKYSEYDKYNVSNIKDIKSEFQFERLLKNVKRMDRRIGNGILKM